MKTAPVTIDHDALWPRDERHRYRLYARRGEGTATELEVLCACPDPGGIGAAIVAFHQDLAKINLRLADLGQIGVYDVRPAQPTGEWLVLPFGRSTR